MNLTDALRAYDYHVDVVLKLGRSTWTHRLKEARSLAAYLNSCGVTDTTQITADAVMQFDYRIYGKRDQPRYDLEGNSIEALADSTYNEYISKVRQFIIYLREEGLLGDDQSPERVLHPRRRPSRKTERQFLYREELLEKAELAAGYHIRDKYLVIFGHYMARRASELELIQIRHISLSPRKGAPIGEFEFINVKKDGRRGDRESMPFQKDMVPFLREWLDIYAKELGRPLRPSDYLIPALRVGKGWTRKGQRRAMVLHPESALSYTAMREALARVGVYGTHAMRRGGLVAVKEEFGIRRAKTLAKHSDERVTEKYMNMKREVEELGEIFAGTDTAQPAAPAPREPEVSAMDELAARRARRNQAS